MEARLEASGNGSSLYPYQKQFLDLVLEAGVLQFGDFQLKSGRRSPYFFHIARLFTGANLRKLGKFYAEALKQAQWDATDIGLFGPAYKGIPLVSALAQTFASEDDRDLPCLFNRKEEKGHGEGGREIGSTKANRYLIVDDVLTSGTSVDESLVTLKQAGLEAAGIVVALDRQEKVNGGGESAREVLAKRGLGVISIVRLTDIIEYLRAKKEFDTAQKLQDYRENTSV